MWYVYLLICSNGKTYIGCTNNLKDRLHRHRKGHVSSTKDRLPVKLIAYFAIRDKSKAYAFEKFLKTGAGRVFL